MARSSAPQLTQVRWRAFTSEGLGHAFAERQSRTALCGVPGQDERFDHPVKVRCSTCEAAR